MSTSVTRVDVKQATVSRRTTFKKCMAYMRWEHNLSTKGGVVHQTDRCSCYDREFVLSCPECLLEEEICLELCREHTPTVASYLHAYALRCRRCGSQHGTSTTPQPVNTSTTAHQQLLCNQLPPLGDSIKDPK